MDKSHISGEHAGTLSVSPLNFLGHAKLVVTARISVSHEIDVTVHHSLARPDSLWASVLPCNVCLHNLEYCRVLRARATPVEKLLLKWSILFLSGSVSL